MKFSLKTFDRDTGLRRTFELDFATIDAMKQQLEAFGYEFRVLGVGRYQWLTERSARTYTATRLDS